MRGLSTAKLGSTPAVPQRHGYDNAGGHDDDNKQAQRHGVGASVVVDRVRRLCHVATIQIEPKEKVKIPAS
jgi:hypothetical protein